MRSVASHLPGQCDNTDGGQTCIDIVMVVNTCVVSPPPPGASWPGLLEVSPVMASKVIPWYKKKRVSQVKSDYAFQHIRYNVQQHTER